MDISKLDTFYERLEPIVETLKQSGKIDTPLKDEGWSPRQLIHHLADAQAQAYYRIVWLLTEDNTTLKPFDQDDWVSTTNNHPVDASMAMIRGIYARWYALIDNLDPELYDKAGIHPEIGEVTVGGLTKKYLDHGESHIAQFSRLLSD